MTDNTTIKDVATLIEELSFSLAEELFIEPDEIDVEMNFTDMGLDSIIGVEWIRNINKKYGTSISTARIYQFPNVVEFAQYLFSELNKSDSDENVNAKDKTDENKDDLMQSDDAAVSNENTEKLIGELVESLAEELFLDVDEIDLESSFLELGLDSIIGVEWIRKINKKYGTSISTTKIYQYPDLTAFAEYLNGVLSGTDGAVSAKASDSIVSDENSNGNALDDLLRAVYQGDAKLDEAAKLLNDLQG